LQSEGIAGLFRGLSTTLARDLPFNFVFLGSYEAIVSAFASMHGENATKDSLTSFEILSAGILYEKRRKNSNYICRHTNAKKL